MYGDSLNLQYENLLASLGAGFVFGAVYDVIRFIRTAAAEKKYLLIFLDIIYPLFVGVVTYLVALGVNYGAVRFYIAAGELLGAVVYNFTVSKYLFHRIVNAYEFIRNKTRRVFSFILKPLNALDSGIDRKSNDIGLKIKKRMKKSKFFRKIDLKPRINVLYNKFKYNFFYCMNRMKGGGRSEGEEKP